MQRLLKSRVGILVMGLIAGGAMAGTVVYAAPSLTGEDIIDETLFSKDIKNGQVTTSDLQNFNALNLTPTGVTTEKIATGAVTSVKIADGTIKASDIAKDAINLKMYGKEGASVSIAAGATVDAYANCPFPDLLTGGGYQASNKNVEVFVSRPDSVSADPNKVDQWSVKAFNKGSSTYSVKAIALCIDSTIP